MTEAELRNHVVATAKAWHGRKESNGSFKEIIDVYNSHKPLARGYKVQYSDEWCATYVSAVAIRCGITDILPTECSCYYMVELFKKLGRWNESDNYKPQPGDVILYDWQDSGVGDNTGVPDHVGIVCSVSGTTMQIIEGNMSSAVGYRNLQVNARYIRGYGLPDYAKKATGFKAPAVTNPTESTKEQIHIVKKDDSLWRLAEKYLGNGNLYPQIMAANNLTTTWIYPGMELKIPGLKSETSGGDSSVKTCTVTLPQLAKGDTGQSVKALQTLLILHGYKLPNYGADGDFGDETKTVLELFQKAENLAVDGVAGPKTWKALVG